MAGNRHHETADVNPRAITWFGIGLVLVCIFSLLMLVLLFKYFEGRERAKNPAAPAVSQETGKLPPEPRLQRTPIVDLKRMRDAEDQILGSYGWLDQSRGVVRIPITRAMDLVVERGLPARPQAPAPSAVSVPTDSGLGTNVEGQKQ